MIKHIILWQLKDELSDERNTVKAGIKASLEALAGRIPGLKEIHVQTECLESSNADVMLDALLDSPEALKVYASHPEHTAVADRLVRPNTRLRICMDYEI